jgi:DNA-binding transcriptional LysR family regulator
VGRNIRITDAGRAVRQLALRTIDEARQVEEFAEGYTAFERGEITIASGRVAGAHLLAGWIAPFVREHPHLELRITLAPVRELLTVLVEGAADVVIIGTRVREPDVETLVLDESELVIVVASHHPLASGGAPALHAHRYLAHETGSGTQTRAAQVLGDAAAGFNVLALEEGALHAALLAGIGFAVMPHAVVASEIADGRLVVLPHTGRRVLQPFTAARRRDLHTPAADAFWKHLATIARQ